jgi:hypothetical protein
MSNDTILQSPAPAEGTDTPTGPHSIEDILKNAQSEMATILEIVETARTASAEFQRLAAIAHTDAQAKLSEITDAATQAVAAKTKITDEQAVIAVKSDHIQDAQEHADKVRGELDRVLTAANQQATTAEGHNSKAKTAADTAAALLQDIQKNKGAVEIDVAAIDAARKKAEESTTLLKGLADKSTKVETHVAEYEKRLAELELQCANQLKTITDLLPGATSAGLASAFDDRRQTFLKPHDRWQGLFVGSLLALMVVAIHGFLALYHSGPEGTATVPAFDTVLRLWLSRLPVAGALVWLALHASREAALAKRLEEDYGYKSAIASSFLGFHKQMAEIGSAAESNKPLAKLCGDVLTTMASPPGRIYEKHKLTVTPADGFTEAAKATANIINPTTNPPK